MIAPPDIVSQILAAMIALLAITFGVLQFYPRIIAMWRPTTSNIPISQLVQFDKVKQIFQLIKIAILLLALSILIGISYLIASAFSVLNQFIPHYVDITLIVIGLMLLASAICLITIGAFTLKVELFSGKPE